MPHTSMPLFARYTGSDCGEWVAPMKESQACSTAQRKLRRSASCSSDPPHRTDCGVTLDVKVLDSFLRRLDPTPGHFQPYGGKPASRGRSLLQRGVYFSRAPWGPAVTEQILTPLPS